MWEKNKNKKNRSEIQSLGTHCSIFGIPLSEIPALTDDQSEEKKQRYGNEEEEKDLEHSHEQAPLRSSGASPLCILTTHIEPKRDPGRKGEGALELALETGYVQEGRQRSNEWMSLLYILVNMKTSYWAGRSEDKRGIKGSDYGDFRGKLLHWNHTPGLEELFK